MAGLAFEIFNFLNAFLRHDLIGEYIHPGTDEDKRRSAFESCGYKRSGTGSCGHLHLAGKHGLHRRGCVGLENFHIESMFLVQSLFHGNGEKAGSGVNTGLANAHLYALRIDVSSKAEKEGDHQKQRQMDNSYRLHALPPIQTHFAGFHFSKRLSAALSDLFSPAPRAAMMTIGTNIAAIWKRWAATELR